MSSDNQPHIYEIKGRVADGFYGHFFVKYVVATNEKRAIDRIMSEIGSKHHAKRGKIRVESVEEVKDPDKIDDPIIKQMMQLERRKRRVSKPERPIRLPRNPA